MLSVLSSSLWSELEIAQLGGIGLTIASSFRFAELKFTDGWRRLGHDIGFGIGIGHGFATPGTMVTPSAAASEVTPWAAASEVTGLRWATAVSLAAGSLWTTAVSAGVVVGSESTGFLE